MRRKGSQADQQLTGGLLRMSMRHAAHSEESTATAVPRKFEWMELIQFLSCNTNCGNGLRARQQHPVGTRQTPRWGRNDTTAETGRAGVRTSEECKPLQSHQPRWRPHRGFAAIEGVRWQGQAQCGDARPLRPQELSKFKVDTDLDAASRELDADGGLRLQRELVPREPAEQVGLADAGVADEHHLKEVIVAARQATISAPRRRSCARGWACVRRTAETRIFRTHQARGAGSEDTHSSSGL